MQFLVSLLKVCSDETMCNTGFGWYLSLSCHTVVTVGKAEEKGVKIGALGENLKGCSISSLASPSTRQTGKHEKKSVVMN